MKKFLSLIIAMLLIVSLFATTAVAFAEGETTDTYTVTYDVGDSDKGTGTAPSVSSKKAGDEFTLASATTFTAKKGYEFAGWVIDDETTVRAAGDKVTMPAKNITIKAQWKDFDRSISLKNPESGNALMNALAEDEFFSELKWQMGDIKLGVKMMESAEANLHEIFNDIIYIDADNSETGEKKSDNDKIYVEYCRPSESPKGQEEWQNSTQITSTIRLSSSGWYLFRIVVKDKSANNVLYTSEKFSRYAEDTKNPVVSLSTSMKDKVNSGLTEGTSYSVSTSLTITDSSSTTVTYKIYKYVDGAWTTDPVYDSVTNEVAEGYDKYISTSGVITPAKEDISDKDHPVYKIVYSVVDSNGYYGVEADDKVSVEFNPEMLLYVNAAPEEKKDVNVLEIVLFSIAGAAAIGIVVLLCIKPKESAPARVAANAEVKEDETPSDEAQD